MKKTYEVKVSGRVQGVNFRYSAMKKAIGLGIVGFVRNESDGTVLIEAEGEEESLEKFLAWCRKGPFFAKVDRLDFSEIPARDYSDFKIAR